MGVTILFNIPTIKHKIKDRNFFEESLLLFKTGRSVKVWGCRQGYGGRDQKVF